MKLLTWIITEQRCILRTGIYISISKQSVLVVDILKTGELGRCEDRSDYDKDQILLQPDNWVSGSEQTCRALPSLGALGGHGSMMQDGKES